MTVNNITRVPNADTTIHGAVLSVAVPCFKSSPRLGVGAGSFPHEVPGTSYLERVFVCLLYAQPTRHTKRALAEIRDGASYSD